MKYHNLEGTIIQGLPYDTPDMIELEKCKEMCTENKECIGYTYGFKTCYLFKEFDKVYGENSAAYRYYSGIKKN